MSGAFLAFFSRNIDDKKEQLCVYLDALRQHAELHAADGSALQTGHFQTDRFAHFADLAVAALSLWDYLKNLPKER